MSRPQSPIKPLPPPLHSIDHLQKYEEQFADLISGVIDMFRDDSHESDLSKVYKAEEHLRGEMRSVKAEMEKKQNEARELTRSFQQLKLVSARSSSQPSTAEHEASMATAQAGLLAALKGNSELEQNRNRLQREAERLAMELREEEETEVGGEELDGEVMRLKLYRSFGFTPILSPSASSSPSYNKFLVQSRASSDVRTIQTDKDSPDFVWSNRLWEALAA